MHGVSTGFINFILGELTIAVFLAVVCMTLWIIRYSGRR
jgi:hypothetical protein